MKKLNNIEPLERYNDESLVKVKKERVKNVPYH